MKPQFQNIPATGFEYTTTKAIEQPLTVTLNMSGVFKLSIFSLIQLINGAKLIEEEKLFKGLIVSLVARLSDNLVNQVINKQLAEAERPDTSIDLSREEVKMLVVFLKLRMSHCEQVRDKRETHANGKEVFNPDSYIAQKFLLLELREWLLGDV